MAFFTCHFGSLPIMNVRGCDREGAWVSPFAPIGIGASGDKEMRCSHSSCLVILMKIGIERELGWVQTSKFSFTALAKRYQIDGTLPCGGSGHRDWYSGSMFAHREAQVS